MWRITGLLEKKIRNDLNEFISSHFIQYFPWIESNIFFTTTLNSIWTVSIFASFFKSKVMQLFFIESNKFSLLFIWKYGGLFCLLAGVLNKNRKFRIFWVKTCKRCKTSFLFLTLSEIGSRASHFSIKGNKKASIFTMKKPSGV